MWIKGVNTSQTLLTKGLSMLQTNCVQPHLKTKVLTALPNGHTHEPGAQSVASGTESSIEQVKLC